MKKTAQKSTTKPGPKEDRLKLDVLDWESAVEDALKTYVPTKRWSEADKKKLAAVQKKLKAKDAKENPKK